MMYHWAAWIEPLGDGGKLLPMRRALLQQG
jgi:hypothetical protein